ncbi:uncharacterized protein Eint_040830 [Encephalitozoon intestinalis ATCC 50506]|uniref:Uncharacterized protein n=1 Tax=Encephalitozoon intestinalis (strain ATCC 50506) TaxID=876142 RepID=E0S6N8_ENCIT|nr:uncharacterized protein Eint_040830 [Encephalitozoon intestinalis ATCC 50506]ADM11373.1 hypothetical protein Eint_040830 [Encephalitozoon intestinalis ATCC 50506]UTX45063.1 hypothetical protein GPK93_04g06000 [Encephalitozoon intestinalis]
MMHGWKVFKYSRRVEGEEGEKSFCGIGLEEISRVILHSEVGRQGIIKERWLHVFTEGSKTLGLALLPSMLEVRVYIVSAIRQELVILERIKLEEKWDIRVCVSKRVIRCRCKQRKFQVIFFSKEDSEDFASKFGHFSKPPPSIPKYFPLIGTFEGLDGNEKKEKKTPKYKKKKKVIEEFLSLLFEALGN